MSKAVVCIDWTNTLVDESKLDRAVCIDMEKKIAEKRNISFEDAHKVYVEFLKGLEGKWMWFSYPWHGKEFGIDWIEPQVRNLNKLIVFPYARKILKIFRDEDYKVCLTTNAAEDVALMRVDKAKLLYYFDLIVGCDTVKAMKSEGKHYKLALEYLNGKTEKSWAIGDNLEQYIEPGIKLGMRTVLCKYGPKAYLHTNNAPAAKSKEIAHYEVSSISDIDLKDLASQQF
jgi:FMN phosphatase YigB (HAD superfamily)